MTLALRPYQSELLEATRAALKRARSVVVQLPTGGGKTALGTAMLGGVVARGLRGNFIVHRQELIDQTVRIFADAALPYGVVAAGYPSNPYQPVQLCSIDTLRHRLIAGKPLPRVAMTIWDECHHVAAPSWERVMGYFAGALHVGLSATPNRLDGAGLADWFGEMVCGPSTADLIRMGFLAPYRAFAPSTPDTSKLRTRLGDFEKRETAHAMDRPTITGDAIAHYQRWGGGLRGLAFCVSIEHAEHVCAQFNAAGIAAAHVDGSTPRMERRQIVDRFRAGAIRVMTNVDLFGEGFDVPAAGVSIMLRPTKSLALFLQQCGRVLRPEAGKDHAVILDHAGNIARHGLPDDARSWSLDGEERVKARPSGEFLAMRKCPGCKCCHIHASACPSCGHSYAIGPRVVAMVDGELEEITVDPFRRDAAARAQSIDDLIAIGRERGYRKPEEWAAGQMVARRG